MLGCDDIWGNSDNLNEETIIFNIYEKAKTDGIQMGKKKFEITFVCFAITLKNWQETQRNPPGQRKVSNFAANFDK